MQHSLPLESLQSRFKTLDAHVEKLNLDVHGFPWFATTQLSTLTHAKQQQQDQRVALIDSSNHVLCSNARLATMTPSNNKSTTEQCRNQQGAEPPVDDSMDISESTNSNNDAALQHVTKFQRRAAQCCLT